MNHMAGCFRSNKDYDDMRLEWDAYIDSTSSEDTTGLLHPSTRTDMMMDRVPGWNGGDHNRIIGYRDAPCQPLLASRGSYLGQLKLSVYVNCGLLTCHVIQARHLASKNSPSCDSYLKISLVPDESMRTRCKTDVVLDTNNPLYDEKFSFELLEEDMKKRIYISAWNKVPGKDSKDEFLGCMSFGIRHIQSERRAVNGWYYLLTEEVGRRKHLQALIKKQQLRERCANTNNGGIPKVNQDIMWMDPYTISISKKSRSGYGFTVSGFSPVFVCKVEKGTPADEAGLLKDDCIVRIDGLNVSRSTSDSVAKLIRNTSKQITLEIQRPQVVTAMDIVPTAYKPWEAVASTPMTRVHPPTPHVPGAPIPSQPPIPYPHHQPHPHHQSHPHHQPNPHHPSYPHHQSHPTTSINPHDQWNMEIESKEPIYGNCGVFGESDPLYSTVTVETPHAHSSASSSTCSQDPPYGMIKVPRSRASSTGRTNSTHSSTGTHHTSGHSSSGCSYHSNGMLARSSSQYSNPGSTDLAYTVCTLPRSRNSVAISQNMAYRFPKSQSSGAVNAHVNNQYRLYHDLESVYGSVTSTGPTTHVTTCAHDDSGIYGYLHHYGSAGSAGSAHSGDSGSASRSKTLPRQKKKVHFQ